VTPDEIVILARYVRALCPAQKFDEYTPDAWGDVFARTPYSLADCRQGAARAAAKRPFVSPAEILAEVRTIRDERLADFQYEPPAGDSDPNYGQRLREQRAAVADGRRPPVLERAITGPTFPELQAAAQDRPYALPTAEERPERRGPLGVTCPACRAPIGRPCHLGRMRVPPHAARRRAANGQTLDPRDTARSALAALTPEQRAALIAELETNR
jgi:hypothetical protein